MTFPVNAVPASQPHESVLPVLSAVQVPRNVASTGSTVAPDGLGKVARPTASEKSHAMDEINKSLKMASIGVRFEFDKEANKMVTKVVDVESGELIRQMPSEEVVRIARAMNSLTGLLFAKSV